MVFAGHLLGFTLILTSIWWIFGNISVLPDYKLVIALVAITILVINHFRWWALCRRMENRDSLEKVNYFLVTHYLVIFLFLGLLGFGRS